MDMQKPRAGDPWTPSASFQGTMIDDHRLLREVASGARGRVSGDAWGGGIVIVKNASASDRGRYAVMGIDDTILNESTPSFKNKIVLSVNTPVDDSTPANDQHRGKFAVLQEPIAAGKYGLAMIAGITPCLVDFQAGYHQFADVKNGDATCLASGNAGSARVLYPQAMTGTRWTYVALGGGYEGLEPFQFKDYGYEVYGTPSNTIDVYEVWGNQLGNVRTINRIKAWGGDLWHGKGTVSASWVRGDDNTGARGYMQWNSYHNSYEVIWMEHQATLIEATVVGSAINYGATGYGWCDNHWDGYHPVKEPALAASYPGAPNPGNVRLRAPSGSGTYVANGKVVIARRIYDNLYQIVEF